MYDQWVGGRSLLDRIDLLNRDLVECVSGQSVNGFGGKADHFSLLEIITANGEVLGDHSGYKIRDPSDPVHLFLLYLLFVWNRVAFASR